MNKHIFIAYSHADLAYKEELKKSLSTLIREKNLNIWDDYDIEAGQDWDAQIKDNLQTAGIILLLVSSDSLASKYFYEEEVKISLERHDNGEAVVVPVILRRCDWKNSLFGNLEALPDKGRPVSEWRTRDEAWQDTVNRLRRLIENAEAKQLANKSAMAEALKADPSPKLTKPEAEMPRHSDKARQPGNGRLNTRPLLLGIACSMALLLIVWGAIDFCNRTPLDPNQPAPTESPDQLEAAGYQKAKKLNTIPAFRIYLSRYPAGKNAASARQALNALEAQLQDHLSDARLLLEGKEPEASLKQLEQALLLYPGHAVATDARSLVQNRKYPQAIFVLKKSE